MLTNRAWLAPLAVAIACCLLLPSIGFGTVGDVLVTVAAISAALAIYLGVRPRERYDLQSLREFHESEELREIDPGDVSDEADRIVCVRCGRDYSARFPICPHCGS
jgi:hypothetical protein